MIDGKVDGLLPARPEPGGRLGPRPGAAARHGQPRLARRARPLRDRERDVLEGRARGRDRRDRARGVPHRGVPLPGRVPRREGGHLHPDPADAAVAREGGRPAGRLPLASCGSSTTWAGWCGSAWPAPPTSATGPLLDLAWDYPVHDEGVLGTEGAQAWGEPSAEAVLKEINGYEVATGRPLSTLRGDEGRRLDGRRLLDLHRRLRRRRQPGRPPEVRATTSRSSPPSGAGRGR